MLVGTMQHFVVLLLLSSGLCNGASASKVLIYPFGHCLNSHLLNAEKLADILGGHGQEVTMLLSNNYQGLIHNVNGRKNDTFQRNGKINYLQFEGPSDFFPVCNYDTVDYILYSPIKDRFDTLIHTFYNYCEQILEDKMLMKELKTRHFDVFIMESLDPCSRILADYLDIPFIQFITAGLGHWDGNYRPPSYLPAAIAPFTPNMSFYQRFINILLKIMYETVPIIMGFDLPFQDLKLRYGLNSSLSIKDTAAKAALKLVNSNFAVEYPAPIEPDTILIGGFAVSTPKPLDIQYTDFIESAYDGVIVMSFGTLVSTFNEHWTAIFATAFQKLTQHVIWKYRRNNTETMNFMVNGSEYGDNIMLAEWIPQTDLLAHPKTRLFITHCGLNGLYEAVTYGVPVIALPLSADQYNHAGKLTNHLKMGEQLDINTVTPDKLYRTILRVLSEPSYSINAKLVQERFRDQPALTADSINYWVNYVVRNKGAEHLKSIARNLTWYQFFSLDVIALMFLLIITFVTITCMIFSFILKKTSVMFYKYQAFLKIKND